MAFLCGGAIRGDSVYGPGLITLRDILEILPFEDAIVVKELSGSSVLAALESALGAYPKQEGRFPVVAGVSIVWDSRLPPGKRIVEAHLLEDGHLFEGVDLDGQPQLKTRRFEMHRFRDTYECTVIRPKMVKREKIDPQGTYRVCSRQYMCEGHDGFSDLTGGRFL